MSPAGAQCRVPGQWRPDQALGSAWLRCSRPARITQALAGSGRKPSRPYDRLCAPGGPGPGSHTGRAALTGPAPASTGPGGRCGEAPRHPLRGWW